MRPILVETNWVVDIGPFDEAILAAVLVRAAELRERQPIFCTLDRDLWPFDKRRQPRSQFTELYAAAGLTVRTDFQVP